VLDQGWQIGPERSVVRSREPFKLW